MPPSLAARITRQSGTNFYYAFRILPAAKRRAIYALYSFCRVVDDCVDEPGGEGEAGLRRWLEEAHRCYAGQPTTELGQELAEALFQFPIPRACFEQIVDGCRMDLTPRRYATFADLRVYCEKVASAVGLASIEIFEYRHPRTREYAVELGVALQLTNILRDIGADGARGRLYLPLEDLARFGVAEAEVLEATPRPAASGGRRAPALRGRARARALRPRGGPPARGGPAGDGVRGADGGRLPGAARRAGPPRLPARTAAPALDAAQALGRRPHAGPRVRPPMKVVVIGGGFAGLAAAIALQERRHEVTLLERRGVLGGRATSFPDTVSGEDVDNGTHLMIAGYDATLDLLRRAGASDLLLVQDHLRIDYRDDRGWTSLDCPDLPAPWHLLAGLLPLRLPWRSRLDVLRFGLAARAGRVPRGLTLAEWFERTGQSAETRRLVWDPLATAILNETPERAAAVLFREVFREAFLRRRDAARLVFLRAGYGRLHERLARYLEARGGVVHRRALAESVEVADGRARAVHYVQRAETKDEMRRGARAITASRRGGRGGGRGARGRRCPRWCRRSSGPRPPSPTPRRLRGSPIVSIELWLDRVVLDRPMAGLRETEVEWVFDKGRLYGREGAPQHVAFIVSAAVRSAPRPNAELAAIAEAALRRYFAKEMAEARVAAVARAPRARGHVRVRPGGGRDPARPGDADPGTVPGRGLDGHRPARHDRGRRPQRPPRRGRARRTLTDRPAPVAPGPARLSRARGLALAWLLVWAPAYAWGYGWANFLQLCDLAVILTCVGLWRGSPLLLGMSALSSLVIDVAWDLDLAFRALTGGHLFGGTEYMWDPRFPLSLRLLSLFHVAWPATALVGAPAGGLRPPGPARPGPAGPGGAGRVARGPAGREHQLRPGGSVHASFVGARAGARGADRARAGGPRLRAHARPCCGGSHAAALEAGRGA